MKISSERTDAGDDEFTSRPRMRFPFATHSAFSPAHSGEELGKIRLPASELGARTSASSSHKGGIFRGLKYPTSLDTFEPSKDFDHQPLPDHYDISASSTYSANLSLIRLLDFAERL